MSRRGKRKKFKPHERIQHMSDESLSGKSPIVTYKRAVKKDKLDSFWYIANGYLNDLIDLLEDFEACPGWKLADFSTCWRKKSFPLIFRGRQTFKELLEFSEEIALLTKRFLLRPHSIKRRIGALYCLYGLYFKHPMRQFFDLKFDLQEYNETLSLVQPFRGNVENPDPAFVFRKLEVSGAIKHCATSMEMCAEFHNREREMVDLEYSKDKLSKSSTVNEAIPISQLEADHQLMQHYHNMKLKLSDSNSDTVRAVCLVNPELFSSVIDNLTELRKEALDELGIKEDNRKSLDNEMHMEKGIVYGENDMARATGSNSVLNTGADIASDTDVNVSNDDLFSDDNINPDVDKVTTINRGKRAVLSKSMREAEKIFSNEMIDKFMGKKGHFETIFLPERKPSKKKIKQKLNLNDIKPEPYVDKVINGHLLIHVPQLDKENRTRRRNIVLQKFRNIRHPIVRRGLQYRPNVIKCIVEDVDCIGISAVPASATSMTLHKQTRSDMLQMMVKMNIKGEEIFRKLKLKVSNKQWNDMKTDDKRMQKFKNRIFPLLGITGISSEDVHILDIVAVPAEDKVKKKPATSNASTVVLNSIYMKEQREECKDTDYDPFSDEEDKIKDELLDQNYEHEKDVDSYDEFDDFEHVDENVSDEEDGNYFQSTYFKERKCFRSYSNKEYYFERDRLGVFNNELIGPSKENSSKVKMIPIKIGKRIKYIPMSNSTELPVTKENDVCLDKKLYDNDLNCCRDDNIVFHSFNDYTTADKPPPNPSKNHSIYGNLRKNFNPYSIMCVRNNAGDKIGMVTPSHGRSREPRNGNNIEHIKKVMSRKGPNKVFSNMHDPVFFEDTSDTESLDIAQLKQEIIMPDYKKDLFSPTKSNTELYGHPSIESLANDWEDIEEVNAEADELTVYYSNDEDSVQNDILPNTTEHSGENSNLLNSTDYSRENSSLPNKTGSSVENGIVPEQINYSPSTSQAYYTGTDTSASMFLQVNHDKMFTLHAIDIGNIFKPISQPMSNTISGLTGNDGFIYSTIPFVTPKVEQHANMLDIPIINENAHPISLEFNSHPLTPFQMNTQSHVIPISPIMGENSTTEKNPSLYDSTVTIPDRKPTCGFLFSSKFKSLKRLSTSRGEASGKPPSNKRTVKFLKKGFLK